MTTQLHEDDLTGSLDAFGVLPPWLSSAMNGERVAASLGRHVTELRNGTQRLAGCTPERLRSKGDQWLARYRLEVVAAEETRDVVLVGNLWSPARAPAVGTSDGTGAGFGEPGWQCTLPDLRLQLRTEESDEALPALPQLVEPEAAARLLQPVLHDAGYPATITSCEPVVVRYKPGSRCTVVVHLQYADGPAEVEPPSPVVLKTHQGDKGRTAWEAMTALWRRPVSGHGAVVLAEPLAYLPQQRILVQGPVPEEVTLKELARTALADGSQEAVAGLEQELTKTARALAAVHGSGASYGRTATVEEEIAEVEEVVDRLSLSVPALRPAAAPVLRRLRDLSQAHGPDPVVPAHHDFRPAQVLLHQGAIGFIDFDGACMAEPALDVGRFRAKLRDIGICGLWMRDRHPSPQAVAENLRLLDRLCEHFLEAYLTQAPVSRERVLIWETCDLVTSMLHAWTKVRIARLEPRLAVLRHQLATMAG